MDTTSHPRLKNFSAKDIISQQLNLSHDFNTSGLYIYI